MFFFTVKEATEPVAPLYTPRPWMIISPKCVLWENWPCRRCSLQVHCCRCHVFREQTGIGIVPENSSNVQRHWIILACHTREWETAAGLLVWVDISMYWCVLDTLQQCFSRWWFQFSNRSDFRPYLIQLAENNFLPAFSRHQVMKTQAISNWILQYAPKKHMPHVSQVEKTGEFDDPTNLEPNVGEIPRRWLFGIPCRTWNCSTGGNHELLWSSGDGESEDGRWVWSLLRNNCKALWLWRCTIDFDWKKTEKQAIRQKHLRYFSLNFGKSSRWIWITHLYGIITRAIRRNSH